MSPKNLLAQIVKGAAFATAAAILAPVNVLFLLRGSWFLVGAIGLVQLALLITGVVIMISASRASRKE